MMDVIREERRQQLWCDAFVAAIEADREYYVVQVANMAVEEFDKQFPKEVEPEGEEPEPTPFKAGDPIDTPEGWGSVVGILGDGKYVCVHPDGSGTYKVVTFKAADCRRAKEPTIKAGDLIDTPHGRGHVQGGVYTQAGVALVNVDLKHGPSGPGVYRFKVSEVGFKALDTPEASTEEPAAVHTFKHGDKVNTPDGVGAFQKYGQDFRECVYVAIPGYENRYPIADVTPCPEKTTGLTFKQAEVWMDKGKRVWSDKAMADSSYLYKTAGGTLMDHHDGDGDCVATSSWSSSIATDWEVVDD